MAQIKDIQWITTASEGEAFIRKQSHQKHQPRYNILLKDSKSYPFIALDLTSLFQFTAPGKPPPGRSITPLCGACGRPGLTWRSIFQLRVCRCKISREVPAKNPACITIFKSAPVAFKGARSTVSEQVSGL